jgi:hypothetical protein
MSMAAALRSGEVAEEGSVTDARVRSVAVEGRGVKRTREDRMRRSMSP